MRRESERFHRVLRVVTVDARSAKRDTPVRPYTDYIIPSPDFEDGEL